MTACAKTSASAESFRLHLISADKMARQVGGKAETA